MSQWDEERAWWAERDITWTDAEWRRIKWKSRRQAAGAWLRDLVDAIRGRR